MKDNLENEQLNEGSQPAVIESLSEPAIRRRIFTDAVQHPACPSFGSRLR
jgi:hypothetical protein